MKPANSFRVEQDLREFFSQEKRNRAQLKQIMNSKSQRDTSRDNKSTSSNESLNGEISWHDRMTAVREAQFYADTIASHTDLMVEKA